MHHMEGKRYFVADRMLLQYVKYSSCNNAF
jgi:hypothetical protein